jgi:NAD(P)-dependent dehydrogenase (short-subunit alcohol dehydrogenase family)
MKDRVVIVSGGSRGLGQAVIDALLGRGACG